MADEVARILVVGQVPPPVHGQALQIQRIVEHDFDDLRVNFIPMALSETVGDIGRFSLAKVARLIDLIREVRRFARQYPHASLYFPPAPARPWPMLRDAILLPAVRRRFTGVVVALHAAGQHEYFDRNWATRLLAVAIYGKPLLAILNTPLSEKDAKSLGARECRVIPIGIDDPGEPSPRPVCPDRLEVLAVGHVCEEKGSLDLLEAVALLVRRGIDVELRVVGPFGLDITQDRFLAVARELEVADHVHTLGVLRGSALADVYRQAHVLAFPTRFAESLGVVAIEAMSHGIPVVASRQGGVPFVVEHGVTGLLHQAGDVGGIAAALEILYGDPGLRERLGSSGRQRFLDHFEQGRYWQALGDALRDVATQALRDE